MKDVADWLIENGIKYEKSGEDYLMICPFHKDTKPSFRIRQDNGVYHCFSCGAKGGIVAFVAQITNNTYDDAKELVYGTSKIHFRKRILPTRSINNTKFNELLLVVRLFIFREIQDFRLLDLFEDYIDNPMFDELIECQTNLMNQANSTMYLKQGLFNELVDEIDDCYSDADKYKTFIKLGKEHKLLKREIRMGLNLFNSKLFKMIKAEQEYDSWRRRYLEMKLDFYKLSKELGSKHKFERSYK